jgi:hypothetical protein
VPPPPHAVSTRGFPAVAAGAARRHAPIPPARRAGDRRARGPTPMPPTGRARARRARRPARMPPTGRARARRARRPARTPSTGRARRRPARRSAVLVAVAGAALLLPDGAPSAHAAQLVVRPSADASVSLARPDARFGRRRWLRIASRPGWRTYLRFSVSRLDAPVVSATLVLHGRRRTWTPRIRVRAIGRPWREPRVSARRARHLQILGLAAMTRRDGRRTRRVALDVTAAASRPGVVTVELSTPNRRGLTFWSREARRRGPRLVIRTGSAGSAQAGPQVGGGPVTAGGGAASAPRSPGGLWISRAELAARPASGAAWNAMKAGADAGGTAAIADQDSDHDVNTLAAAFVAARTGAAAYRDRAVAGIAAAIGTEAGGRTLALGRNLPSYVVAADVVNLPAVDPSLDGRLRAWLAELRAKDLGGDTLVSTHELRPNNWGTMAGAARIAADAYVGDTADLRRAAAVLRGWLGERSAYAGFNYGDLSYQADPGAPVGVNPAGAVKDGVSIDGAIPDDMRRGCPFAPIPCQTDYPWEAMQGAVVQAELLRRQGYDAWSWGDRALLRAARYLLDLDARFGGWWATADDTWQPWLLNHAYGASLPARTPSSPGKVMAWSDWTHAG